MLNEEKIRLMTKAASYEAGEGKKTLSMNKYFRGDYISLNLIKAGISYTIAFGLCLGLWCFYHMEDLMANIHKMDLASMGKGLAAAYVGFLVLYLLINYVVFHLRYQKSRRSLAMYNQLLKKIAHIYQIESRSGSSNLTAGGTIEDDDLTGI